MKLLSKKVINDRVQTERKNAIDAGVFLAKKVDALREEVLTLQKTRDDFITGSQQVINDSLSSLQQKQDSLSKEITELEVKRKELLKPLDEEWAKLNTEKVLVNKGLTDNFILKGQLDDKEKELEKNKQEIASILTKTLYQDEESKKARDESISLKDLAQKEYEIAKENTISNSALEEQKLKELQGKISTYENGISINERKEKDLEIREVALLTERKHLESQQRTFLIAKGIK